MFLSYPGGLVVLFDFFYYEPPGFGLVLFLWLWFVWLIFPHGKQYPQHFFGFPLLYKNCSVSRELLTSSSTEMLQKGKIAGFWRLPCAGLGSCSGADALLHLLRALHRAADLHGAH